MQKAESLTFPTVLGSGGHGHSLLNGISLRAQLLRLWFLRSFNVKWKLDPFIEIRNLKTIPMCFSMTAKTTSQRDVLWLMGVSIMTRWDLMGPCFFFHTFAKCCVHRDLHYVGTLLQFLEWTNFSVRRILQKLKMRLPIKDLVPLNQTWWGSMEQRNS